MASAIKQKKKYSAKWNFLLGKVNFQNSIDIKIYSENEHKIKIIPHTNF
jgi:hypothetical protein